MTTLVQKAAKRERESGKATQFEQLGRPIRDERIRTFKKRKVDALHANCLLFDSEPEPGTPEGITYHTPKPFCTLSTAVVNAHPPRSIACEGEMASSQSTPDSNEPKTIESGHTPVSYVIKSDRVGKDTAYDSTAHESYDPLTFGKDFRFLKWLFDPGTQSCHDELAESWLEEVLARDKADVAQLHEFNKLVKFLRYHICQSTLESPYQRKTLLFVNFPMQIRISMLNDYQTHKICSRFQSINFSTNLITFHLIWWYAHHCDSLDGARQWYLDLVRVIWSLECPSKGILDDERRERCHEILQDLHLLKKHMPSDALSKLLDVLMVALVDDL